MKKGVSVPASIGSLRRGRGLLVSLLLIAVLALQSCDGPAFKEVEPLDGNSSPCFQANLMDGLSEDDPGELRAAFDCINARGAFDGAEGLVAALETGMTRAGEPAALDAARAVNLLVEQVDLLDSIDQVAGLLEEENEFILFAIRALSEWVYGLPWAEVEEAYENGGGALLEPTAVEQGLIQPLPEFLATLSGATLDEGRVPEITTALQTLLTMDATRALIEGLDGMSESDVAELLDTAAEDMGSFLLAAQVEGSDGENAVLSLLLELLAPRAELGQQSTVVTMLAPMDQIVEDEVAVGRLVDTLGELYEDDLLQPLPDQLHSLTVIDAGGGALSPGEVSAFEALFDLLDESDQPVTCGFLFQQDSLALFILETMATWNPSSVETVVNLSSGLVDELLWLGSLVCDGIAPGLDANFPAIVRLAETGALETLVPLLAALDSPWQPQHDRLRETLDILVALERGGVLPAATDLARRELDQPFVGNVLEIVGSSVAPEDPQAPADIHTLLEVVDFLVSPPPGGSADESPVGLLTEPAYEALGTHEGEFAEWLRRLAVLLVDEDSQTHGFLDELAPLLSLDPDFDSLSSVADLLGDPELVEALLRVLETPEVASALADPTSGAGGREGPIGLVGRLSSDGSLESGLSLLVWLMDTFDGLGLFHGE
ncbi:MAG: hypothetical protein VX498_14945 [Myxococcota bacterium]|nr:hypothetical protein [Myxococcota bacterium]